MYYPQSQVTPNLYTNGGEFQISATGEVYKGYYFTVSTGQKFTGRNQNDNPVLELTLLVPNIPNTPITTNINTNLPEVVTLEDITYNNIIAVPTSIIYKPAYNPNVPTQQDYQIGEYRRYFCKKTNEIMYIEIDKTTFDKLISKSLDILWSLYQPFDIPWNLTGVKDQVATVNRNIVLLTMKNLSLPQFDAYLKFDFTKYYV
jgi:hypothetical protein